MKKYILIFILILPAICLSQGNDPQRYDMAFFRIEQAFRNASPENLWPFISSQMTIRLEDSLYQSISNIQTESLLKRFFQSKDSVEFRFDGKFFYFRSAIGYGFINYVVNNKRVSLNVDVYLYDWRGEALISAINISNYPSSTAFFNFSK